MREKIKSLTQSWGAVVVIASLLGFILCQKWKETHPVKPKVVAAGQHLALLSLETVDGKTVDFDWRGDGLSTVVYVFRPKCPWCMRNTAPAKALGTTLGSRYRFLAVSTTRDGLQEYLDKARPPFPVYVAGKRAAALKIDVTPETLVVSPGGVVSKRWLGAYSVPVAADISKVLGVKLPGLAGHRVGEVGTQGGTVNVPGPRSVGAEN